MVKYPVELYNLVYPKWAKIRLMLSKNGGMLLAMNPSLTPGQKPEGISGAIPKGTRIFDYADDKECIIRLNLAECLQIIDFTKRQNTVDTVDIVHRFRAELRVLKISWGNGPSVCNINYSKKNAEGVELTKIYCPVPFNGLREIVAVLNSYVNNFVMINAFCCGEILISDNYKKPPRFKSPEELPNYPDD